MLARQTRTKKREGPLLRKKGRGGGREGDGEGKGGGGGGGGYASNESKRCVIGVSRTATRNTENDSMLNIRRVSVL